jgi:hypothetical protein
MYVTGYIILVFLILLIALVRPPSEKFVDITLDPKSFVDPRVLNGLFKRISLPEIQPNEIVKNSNKKSDELSLINLGY